MNTAVSVKPPNAAKEGSSVQPTDGFTRTWRYKAGIGLFIVGNISLVVGILLPVLGLATGGKAGLVGVLIVGGELVALSSIVLLGKAGFLAIKQKLFGFLESGYAAPVGPVRHYAGIAIMLTNLITTYTLVLYAWTVFGAATPDNSVPYVWGLDLAQQSSLVFWLLLCGELCFLVAIYLLGADWWERFRNVVVWNRSPEPETS